MDNKKIVHKSFSKMNLITTTIQQWQKQWINEYGSWKKIYSGRGMSYLFYQAIGKQLIGQSGHPEFFHNSAVTHRTNIKFKKKKKLSKYRLKQGLQKKGSTKTASSFICQNHSELQWKQGKHRENHIGTTMKMRHLLVLCYPCHKAFGFNYLWFKSLSALTKFVN